MACSCLLSKFAGSTCKLMKRCPSHVFLSQQTSIFGFLSDKWLCIRAIHVEIEHVHLTKCPGRRKLVEEYKVLQLKRKRSVALSKI